MILKCWLLNYQYSISILWCLLYSTIAISNFIFKHTCVQAFKAFHKVMWRVFNKEIVMITSSMSLFSWLNGTILGSQTHKVLWRIWWRFLYINYICMYVQSIPKRLSYKIPGKYMYHVTTCNYHFVM